MEIRGLKYVFLPIQIKDNLYLRKRLLHKGYSLLEKLDQVNHNGEVDHFVFNLIVQTNTLKQTETFLRNEYNIEVTL